MYVLMNIPQVSMSTSEWNVIESPQILVEVSKRIVFPPSSFKHLTLSNWKRHQIEPPEGGESLDSYDSDRSNKITFHYKKRVPFYRRTKESKRQCRVLLMLLVISTKIDRSRTQWHEVYICLLLLILLMLQELWNPTTTIWLHHNICSYLHRQRRWNLKRQRLFHHRRMAWSH